jgi:hypothetical protein
MMPGPPLNTPRLIDPPVLDPDQLKRIESTHRGFLYQHLFAVGSLLLAQEAGVARVVVERDEDLEIVSTPERVYVQVKTRSSSLQRNDIQSTLDQFDLLRAAHASGGRSVSR